MVGNRKFCFFCLPLSSHHLVSPGLFIGSSSLTSTFVFLPSFVILSIFRSMSGWNHKGWHTDGWTDDGWNEPQKNSWGDDWNKKSWGDDWNKPKWGDDWNKPQWNQWNQKSDWNQWGDDWNSWNKYDSRK